MKTIRSWSNDIHALAVTKGWWGEAGAPDSRNIPELLALIHSEVSEALECYRSNDMVTRYAENGKPEGFWTELADVVIRCLDLAGAHDVDLEHELAQKHAFNTTRSFRHGNKLA